MPQQQAEIQHPQQEVYTVPAQGQQQHVHTEQEIYHIIKLQKPQEIQHDHPPHQGETKRQPQNPSQQRWQQEPNKEQYHKQQKALQKQEQINLQQRQFVAAVQSIYDVMGRTLCSFERYAKKVTTESNKEHAPRYTKKYEKHKLSVEEQPAEDILEEMKAQLIVLQFALSRYRDTPEVKQAMVKVQNWELMYKGIDPQLDVMILNLEACLKGEQMNLPETPKKILTQEELLEVVQHYANGSEKAERTTNKFIEDHERRASFNVDADHPDEESMDMT